MFLLMRLFMLGLMLLAILLPMLPISLPTLLLTPRVCVFVRLYAYVIVLLCTSPD